MSLLLENGSRVAVVGGGPSGSLCAYFLLTFSRRIDLAIEVDVYEPRDFRRIGPSGCNMCGGIISESLIQALATEGINLPPEVVQRGIDSYVLHTKDETLRLETPLHEKRIAAVHRGGGPRDARGELWGSLDAYLLELAQEGGARVVTDRVLNLDRDDGRPRVHSRSGAQAYDLLVGACGVKAGGWHIYEGLGLRARPPKTIKTYVTELHLGAETINRQFGSAMHLFLLDMAELDCAAMIPKGEFVTVCLLGRRIDRTSIERFFNHPAVRECFPPGFQPQEGACHCAPRINVREASRPFADRVVLVGDCGATRLYKDGIGAAYRTAKAAALTAVFDGIEAEDFRKTFWPAYRSIVRDNRYGAVVFGATHLVRFVPPFQRGLIQMARREQVRPGGARRMSLVLWDMFTGSASYRGIFLRTLDPRFWFGLARGVLSALVYRRAAPAGV